MDKKGQQLTVEQMFLFTIGLLITIGIFVSFQSIGNNVTEVAVDDQLQESGVLVVSGIGQVAKSLETADRASLILSIPKEISNEGYSISAEGDRLVVALPTGKNATLNLRGMGGYRVTGSVSSSAGTIHIEGSNVDRTIVLTGE